MIFTRKGLLANKKIEEIYILSLLIDQTFYPDELKRIETDLKQSNDVEGDEIFIKAKKISELNSLKTKYENIRKQCIARQNVLKKSFVWILFFYSLRLADYIFQGYTYPPPIRALLSSDLQAPGMISSIFPVRFPIRDAIKKSKYRHQLDSLYGKKNWFESKKLCDAIFNEQVIDFDFLSTIKNISEQIPEIKNYRHEKSSQSFPRPPSDYIEEPINLNKYLIKNERETFIVRVQGDSMNEHNIGHNDTCIIDKSIRPVENHIVVATIGGEFILGCLKRGPNGFEIKKKTVPYGLEKTYFLEEEESEIIGVVTNSITKH